MQFLSFSALACYKFQMQHKISVLVIPLLLFVMISCSGSDHVKEYFNSHGMSYPADVNGVSMLGVTYAGVEQEELSAEGARDFIGSGIAYVKIFFEKRGIKSLVPGADAVIVEKPVLYRGDSEDIGLMVRVTAFGQGEPGPEVKLPVEWVGKEKKFWKIVNFAYFVRKGFYDWELGGWVY